MKHREDMQNTNSAKRNFLTYEACKYRSQCAWCDGVAHDWITCVYCGDFVEVDECGGGEWSMEFLMKLLQPTTLNNIMSNNTILSFSTGARDTAMSLG
jgi:hypothetical protein